MAGVFTRFPLKKTPQKPQDFVKTEKGEIQNTGRARDFGDAITKRQRQKNGRALGLKGQVKGERAEKSIRLFESKKRRDTKHRQDAGFRRRHYKETATKKRTSARFERASERRTGREKYKAFRKQKKARYKTQTGRGISATPLQRDSDKKTNER